MMDHIQRVERSGIIELNALPEVVFPLFTPEGEKKWAEGWDFDQVFPLSGPTGLNSVFTTNTHDHGGKKALWIINSLDSDEYFIEYYKIETDVKIGRISIQCASFPNGKTRANITYIYTGLNSTAHKFLAQFTDSYYADYIVSWEKAINAFLKTKKSK